MIYLTELYIVQCDNCQETLTQCHDIQLYYTKVEAEQDAKLKYGWDISLKGNKCLCPKCARQNH